MEGGASVVSIYVSMILHRNIHTFHHTSRLPGYSLGDEVHVLFLVLVAYDSYSRATILA